MSAFAVSTNVGEIATTNSPTVSTKLRRKTEHQSAGAGEASSSGGGTPRTVSFLVFWWRNSTNSKLFGFFGGGTSRTLSYSVVLVEELHER